MLSRRLNPVPLIASGTRRLQTFQTHRALKGLTRFSNLLHRWLPGYQGVVCLPGGIRMVLNSRVSAERWLLYAGDYQPALTRFLKQQTPVGGACLDIGANLGFYALKFARWVGPTGQVMAFEANPDLAERIRQNVTLNRFSHVTVIGRPVHRCSEPVEFYISPNPGQSSILATQVREPDHVLHLQATTVDEVIEAQGWQRLDVIKIDIEGNDCNALLGARKTLVRFHPALAFEYWYNTPPEVAQEAISLLDELGYTLRGLWRNGRQFPFEWKPTDPIHKHIDVLGR
jgi:FkbM family methyltransferase